MGTSTLFTRTNICRWPGGMMGAGVYDEVIDEDEGEESGEESLVSCC